MKKKKKKLSMRLMRVCVGYGQIYVTTTVFFFFFFFLYFHHSFVLGDPITTTCSNIVPMLFSLSDLGGVGDGQTLNANVFVSTVDRIRKSNRSGGSLLYVPRGVFLTESFNLTSHMTLYLADGWRRYQSRSFPQILAVRMSTELLTTVVQAVTSPTIRRINGSSPFAGIAIGSEASGGVQNITVEDISLYNTGIGIHLQPHN